jgi:hypothetical protein
VQAVKANDIFDVAAGLLLVALATTVVTSKYTAAQITASGNALGGVIASALGKGSIRR